MNKKGKNFFDPETGEEFFISNYIITSNSEYKHKSNMKVIVNPETGTVLLPIPMEGDYEAPLLMKSNDKEKRVEMLRQRSKDHYKKEIHEKKYYMNKEIVEKFKKKE